MRQAIRVALDPDGQQLPVSPRVGVERGQPIDLGTEDFGGRWGDDLELGSGHFGYLQYLRIRVFIGRIFEPSNDVNFLGKITHYLHIQVCTFRITSLFPLRR